MSSGWVAIVVALITFTGVVITGAVAIINALISQGADIMHLQTRATQHEMDIKKEQEMNAALEERINRIVSGDH